jgi:hypothetical protein
LRSCKTFGQNGREAISEPLWEEQSKLTNSSGQESDHLKANSY